MPNNIKLRPYIALKEVTHDKLGNPIPIYKRSYLSEADKKEALTIAKEKIAKKIEDSINIENEKTIIQQTHDKLEECCDEK